MFGMQRHPHEQSGQEDENVRLQEGDEQFEQAQGHHAQHAGERNAAEQQDIAGIGGGEMNKQDHRQHHVAGEHIGEQTHGQARRS